MVTNSSYTKSSALSSAVLTPKQIEYGFVLIQTDDHVVSLVYSGKDVAFFNAAAVSKETIQDVADMLMRGYRLKGKQAGVFETISNLDGNVTLGELQKRQEVDNGTHH